MKDIKNRYTAPTIVAVDKVSKVEVSKMLVQQAKTRTVKDLNDLDDAIVSVYSARNPSMIQLMDIYDKVKNDGHVRGIIGSIKNKIKAKKFVVMDASGEVNEEATEVLEKRWFFNWVDAVVDAEFFGYSVVELGNVVEDAFPNFRLIPREYCVPQLNAVRTSLKGTFDPKTSLFITEDEFKDWVIQIKAEELGLFGVAAPHTLAKRALFAACWDYAQLFGVPFRKGHTDTSDPARRRNMKDMLENMGGSGWAMFDDQDTIDVLDVSKSGAMEVFIEPIKMSNQEISKAFAGGTGMFDEKSFVGSAEVQERLFNEVIAYFLRQVSFATNDELIPRMAIHGILKEGQYIQYPEESGLSKTEKAAMITQLTMAGYKYSAETVTAETGIEVESVEPVEEEPKSVMPDVRALYKDWING